MNQEGNRCFVLLTGREISTSSGGVSRHPSASAYATANTGVLSHSTSRAAKDNLKQRLSQEFFFGVQDRSMVRIADLKNRMQAGFI